MSRERSGRSLRALLPPGLALGLGAAVALAGCGAVGTVSLDGPNQGAPRAMDGRRHAGRVRVSGAAKAITTARHHCVHAGGCTPAHGEPAATPSSVPTLTIARSIAGFRGYPRQVTVRGVLGRGWKDRPVQANDVVALMDRALSAKIGVDAIHLDAYADPAAKAKVCRSQPKGHCAVVVRREPPWSKLSWDAYAESRAYLQRNTLGRALAHFAARYAPRGKGVFIELHEPRACAAGGAEAEHRGHEQIRNVVRRILSVDGGKQRLGPTIGLVSASREMLTIAHEQAEDMGLPDARVRYVLVAGAHFAGGSPEESSCGLVATSTQVLEKARRADKAWMAATPWLDAVWLNPRCFVNGPTVLRALNRARQAHAPALQPLTLGVAMDTWPAPRSGAWMQRQLGKAGRDRLRVSALLFAIDED